MTALDRARGWFIAPPHRPTVLRLVGHRPPAAPPSRARHAPAPTAAHATATPTTTPAPSPRTRSPPRADESVAATVPRPRTPAGSRRPRARPTHADGDPRRPTARPRGAGRLAAPRDAPAARSRAAARRRRRRTGVARPRDTASPRRRRGAATTRRAARPRAPRDLARAARYAPPRDSRAPHASPRPRDRVARRVASSRRGDRGAAPGGAADSRAVRLRRRIDARGAARRARPVTSAAVLGRPGEVEPVAAALALALRLETRAKAAAVAVVGSLAPPEVEGGELGRRPGGSRARLEAQGLRAARARAARVGGARP